VYRAVVLTTLTLLLLGITGITLARESTFGPERDFLTEPTVQNTTTTGEPTATTVLESTNIADGQSTERSEPTEGSVAEDFTVTEAKEPEVTEEQATGGKIEKIGRPEGVGKAKGFGGKTKGSGEARVDEGETRGGGAQDKVTLCHKGKNTIAVGKPAQAAHERHGDTVGPCQTEEAAPEPPEETPGAAQNGDGGGGNGQPKVTLCHKGKTLTVGAPAQAAHLRHGDTEGPCAE
jgi:hypothetical protein